MNFKKFSHLDSENRPWAVVSAEQLWADTYAIKYNRPETRLAADVWRQLFRQAYDAAVEMGAGVVGVRIRTEYEPEIFRTILTEIGMVKSAERIEYQIQLSELPGDEGSPLTWRTARELNWDVQKIADFVGQITDGALDIEPDEKPENFIQDWLSHEELSSGPECISIGFKNETACALVVAQVNGETGWSRLAYVGLLPKFRGQRLGKWIHRRGFAELRKQGGTLYHGGTHGENRAMQKLFILHGCREFCRMEEWSRRTGGSR